jgi:ribosomal-protein-alanine N-acetyltransferase
MDFFNDHLRHYPYTACAVVEKASGELIGHCGLRYIADISETEVLYAFGKDFWGRGYATEAARESVAYGFDRVGLERIIGLAIPENIASCKVLEHCGLEYEKDTHLFDLDLAYYALNREDYNNKDIAT